MLLCSLLYTVLKADACKYYIRYYSVSVQREIYTRYYLQ